MATKRMRARGRHWVALVLLGFVLVAASVIQRRVLGIRQAQEITRLERNLQALEAEKLTLETDIDDLRSLTRLGPIVEQKLGMREPHDSLTVLIQRSSK